MAWRSVLITAAVPLLGAAVLALPWWSGPTPLRLDPGAPTGTAPLSAREVLGPAFWLVAATVLVGLVAVLLVRRAPHLGRAAAAATGAALTAAGCSALLDRGPSPAPGAWAAAGLGVVLLALGLRGAPRRVPAAGAVLALLATVVAALPRPQASVTDGPFVRLAAFDAGAARSGATTLSREGGWVRTLAVDGRPGVGTRTAVTVLDGGRTRVLALGTERPSTPRLRVVGATADSVVTWSGASTLTATSLVTGTTTTLDGVAAASRTGPDGTVLVRGADDPVVHRWRPGEPGPLTALPAVPGTVEDLDEAVPVPDGVLVVEELLGADRLVRLTAAGRTVLAGGVDPGCGLVADARSASLTGLHAVTPVGTDVWFVAGATDDQVLLRLAADGTLTGYGRTPGYPLDLAPAADGLAVAVEPAGDRTGDGLWLLPWSAPGEALPAAAADCAPDPPAVAPPLALTPVADTRGDQLGVPLDARGSWAAQGSDGAISAVGPDGARVPLGVRQDGYRGVVWPDGAGGAWWLEARRGGDSTLQLVHGTPGGIERFGEVTDPAPRVGAFLVPDLRGAPPLLGTAEGLYRVDGGAAQKLSDGVYSGGVVGPDGRGWLVRDRRVVTLDGIPVLGAPGADPAPVRVQLAHGTAPADLVLRDPTLAVDPAGRLLVADGGVLLAVDRAGGVRVLADDPRLPHLPLWTVPGGFAAVVGTGIARVELP